MNVEQFLYHEARLLDTQQYEAWLELFTDDATYWVPLEREQEDPFETSSIIHDDRTLLGLRVKQARHPRAHAPGLGRAVASDGPRDPCHAFARGATFGQVTVFRGGTKGVSREVIAARIGAA